MTTTTKKRNPKICSTSIDDSGALTIELSKPAMLSLSKARRVCDALSKAAPTVSARAKGIREALDALLRDVSGVLPPEGSEDDTDIEEASE